MYICFVYRQRQCHCLKQTSTYCNSIVLINKATRPSLFQAGGFQQRYYFHSLLRLKSKNRKQFKIYDKDINAYITRVSIGQSLYGQRTFTTQVIKVVMRLARVRYLVIGSVGAGAVGAKLVGTFPSSSFLSPFPYIVRFNDVDIIDFLPFIHTPLVSFYFHFPTSFPFSPF